ncbi:MAG: hypothetical protein ACSHXY_09800 [Alphaproteobacteria bacterium]
MSDFTDALARLTTGYYNSLPVSADNPGGLAADGHVANFPAALDDVSELVKVLQTWMATLGGDDLNDVHALDSNLAFLDSPAAGVGSATFKLFEKSDLNVYDGGLPRRTMRYNIVLGDVNAADSRMYLFKILGWTLSTDTKSLIDLTFSGYKNGGSYQTLKNIDRAGTSIPMGQNTTASGKMCIWFEVQNLYTNFTVKGQRVGVHGNLGLVDAILTMTEAGVAL